MKKTIFLFAIPLAIFALAAVFVSPSDTNAQNYAFCPTGYICEPVQCPAGFTCTQTNPLPNCPAGYLCRLAGTIPVPLPNSGGGAGAGSACYRFNYNLTIGATGADVVALQTWLIAKGFDIPAITQDRAAMGYFGPATAVAVRSYQRSAGIPDTGFVGPSTREKLNAFCSASTNSNQEVVVSNTSASISSPIVGPNNEIIAYNASFNFTLTAGNKDIYVGKISGSALDRLVILFDSKVGSMTPSASQITTDPSILAGDSQSYYVIPAGTSRKFTLNSVFRSADASVNGLNTAQITAIKYGTSVGNLISGIVSAGESLKVNLIFTKAGGTTSQPSITVLSPNGGETLQIGKTYDITWRSQGVEQIYISLVTMNGGYEREIQRIANGISTMSGLTGHYNWQVPSNLTTENLNGSVWKIKIVNYNGSIGSGVAYDYSDNYFTITSGTTPQPSTVSVSAQLLNTSDDRAGAWNNFGPGVGNGNKNGADWNWSSVMNGYNLSSDKIVKRMTIVHNTRGEVWSTGYSRYLDDGTDLYGYDGRPYPLVVTNAITACPTGYICSPVQFNKKYDDTGLNQITIGGKNSTVGLYGQRESNTWTGGKLIVEFTDGTSATGIIPASNYTPPTSTQPSITSVAGKAAGNGEIDAGGTVGIVGNNFLSTDPRFKPIVYIVSGSTHYGQCVVTQVSNTIIYCTAPTIITVGNTYDLYLTNDRGTSNKVQVKVLSNVSPTSPTLSLINPIGGEQLTTGQTYNIRWNSSIINNGTVEIVLHDAGVPYVGKVLFSNIPNTGSKSWTVTPLTLADLYDKMERIQYQPTGKYVMKISYYDRGGYTSSSNSFTITSDPVAVRGSCGVAQGVPSQVRPVTGLCGTGSVSNQRSNSVNWLWDCAANNPLDTNDVIGCWAPIVKPSVTPTPITPVSVNGSCGTALNSCQTGTFRDVTDNGGYRYWSCLGSNGGTDRLCTYNVPSTSPVNGSCGTALNSCQTGTFSDVTDNGGYSYWNCLGSNGGTNRLCTYQPNATF